VTAERDQRLRLRDMLRAADRILERTAGGWERFRADEMVQVWVVHHLEVIGEAAARVDAGIKQAHPEVDWIAAAHTRNRLVHGYFDVDLEVIWVTVERDIPRLRKQIVAILEGMSGADVD
jgi:uncharacterized protein with HEPN domain